MDTQTSLLQNINATTNSILNAMGGGGGGSLPDNVLPTDGEQTVSNKTLDSTNTFPNSILTTDDTQTVSNKTLDDTNTFPDSLARVSDINPFSFTLYDFSSHSTKYFENSWLYGMHFSDKNVMILFGQIEVNYDATTKTVLDAGDLYTDSKIDVRFYIHSTPAVYLTIPNSSEEELTITNEGQLEGSFTFTAAIRNVNTYVGSSITQLI